MVINMEYKEFSAKTVDDCITDACTELAVPSDRLDYEVVSEGSTGFMGLGSKPAVIKARIKEENASEANSEVKKEAKEAKKAAKRDAQYRDKLSRAIESGSARKVGKYKSGMSDREIKRAIERINLENSLDSASNQQMLNKFAKFERLSNYARTTANLTSSAITVYNNFAGTLNSLKGKDYKLIRTSPPKEKNQRGSGGSGSGGSGGGSP